jgi:parallel beta-helix repeat protein
MIKRGIIFTIGILFICLLFHSIQAADSYVATTGSDTTGNGSQENPWETIQYAINNVIVGDIIHVANGTYSENIDVNKSVSIIGDGYQNTTVTATSRFDHVFNVIANNTNVSGFTINGSTGINKAGINLYYVTNCNVLHNNASNNEYGIYLYSSPNNTLTSNTANSNYEGIYLLSSSNNSIMNSTFNSNTRGIDIYDSNHSDITNNTLLNNNQDIYDSNTNNYISNQFLNNLNPTHTIISFTEINREKKFWRIYYIQCFYVSPKWNKLL